MESEMKKENTLKYPNFTHLFFVCVLLTACAVRGLAEPTDQVNQQEVNDEEKIQQKAREEYAGLWRIETITSKGDTTEPDKRITIDNKTDGTWVLFIDGKELSSGTNSFAPLGDPKEIDISITGGECAAPGVIALIGICNNIKAKKFLNLNESSNILVIGCEGNADVKLYKQLLSKGRK